MNNLLWLLCYGYFSLVGAKTPPDCQKLLAPKSELKDMAPVRDRNVFGSQYGQDKWIFDNIISKDAYFFEQPFNRTIVEFGARNGKTDSNSFFYSTSLGWLSILGEPGHEYDEIERNRAGSKFVAKKGAFCSTSGERIYVDVQGAHEGWTGRSGFKEELKAIGSYAWLQESMKDPANKIVLTEIPIACYYLPDVIKSTGHSRVTIMSADCEGCELEVLSHFPFHEIPVDIIMIEMNPSSCKILTKLLEHGYILVNVDASDMILVHKRVKTHLPALE